MNPFLCSPFASRLLILSASSRPAVDEFQLVNFIIKSKGLQFLTGGLIGGALGFVKLFRCSTVADPLSPAGCWHKAPGVTKTFRWEFSLLMVRSVLVWITFILLFNFEHLEKWDKKRQAEAATSDPRRGLFKPTKTAGLMAINWVLFAANVIFTVKNLKDGVEHGVTALDTIALNFFFVTVPLNGLLNVRRLRWYPAAMAAALSCGAIGYVVLKYGVIKGHILLNQYSLIASACYAIPIFLVLMMKQCTAMAEDAKKMADLTRVIQDLDSPAAAPATAAARPKPTRRWPRVQAARRSPRPALVCQAWRRQTPRRGRRRGSRGRAERVVARS